MDEAREEFLQRLAKLRKEYQTQLPERIEQVGRACAEILAGDGTAMQLTALYQLAHNLAGSGATFGYHEVSAAARQFEEFIKLLVADSPALTAAQRDQLHAYWALLKAAPARAEHPYGAPAGRNYHRATAQPCVPTHSEKLVFLVDDDQDLATHLEYALRQFGYLVRVFPQLQALDKAVAQTPPLAILMDMVFPEGDLAGAEIIHAINAQREEPIPVIFISVRDDFDARLHAVRTGTTHYLTKPIDIPALVRTLDNITLIRPHDPYRIVLVDDDAELAALYQLHLEGAGMAVAVVTDPRQTLEAMQRERAELVLMDVYMPFCNGLELAAVIRQHEGYAGVAIVFLSTESNIDRQLAAMNLGGDDFLTKPIEPWHLVRSVHARVKRARDLRLARERLASKVLRQGEERFRLAIESTPCGMVMVNREGSIVLVNTQAEKLFGYTREELIGQPVEMLVPERFRDRHQTYRGHFFTDPRPRPMGPGRDIHGRRKDGREVPIEVGLNLIETEEGPLVLGTIVDITERKQAEEALKEADRRKDEFLAMLAHELRNPLAPIRNAVEVLRRRGLTEPKLAWAHDIIGRQVDHMTRLVDDLLDISRLIHGQIGLQKKPFELGEAVEQGLELSGPLIEARHHTLSVSLPEAPVRLDGDRIRLAQVVGNLLNNAAKYTKEGGRIWLTARLTPPGEIMISVKDTGEGIAPELLPEVFKLFTQGSRTLDRSEGGLGIGLTLVRRLVELHGGRVEAKSAGIGQGAEFIVRLPTLPSGAAIE